jgi:hypothetical protein
VIDPKHKAELNMVVLTYLAALGSLLKRRGLTSDVLATALANEATRVKDKVKTIVQNEDERMLACLYVGLEASRKFGAP